MKRFLIAAMLALAGPAAAEDLEPAPFVFAVTLCGANEAVDAWLKSADVSRAVRETNMEGAFEIWRGRNGAWFLVTRQHGGVACVLTGGAAPDGADT